VAQADFSLEDAREIASSFRELSQRYKEFGKTLKQATKETKDLKPLIGRPGEARLEDSWLIRAGVALILFPDPTISDLVGSMMVVAGYLKNRTKKNTAANVVAEFYDTAKSLQKLTPDLER